MGNALSLIERTLDELLPRGRPDVLSAAMRHAVGTGGKRIRPLLCMAASEAVGGRAEDAIYPACAIELLHNYTLVHDDLPAMDNDTERRGKPSVWAKFGEANAILVGDALQALAFAAAARAPTNVEKIVSVLAEKGVGVVAGQVEDIMAQRGSCDVDFIYLHKTADLFIAAAKMGAYAGGADDATATKVGEAAEAIGLAFQFEDDLLDGDSPYDEAETRSKILSLTERAEGLLNELPGNVSPLRELARKMVNRRQ